MRNRQKYYLEHREKQLAAAKRWRENHKEYKKEYQRQYREANKEKIQAYQYKYYWDNREEQRIKDRQYYLDNRERILTKNRNDRIEVKHRVLSHYSGGTNPKCSVCGMDDVDVLCIDHIDGKGSQHRKSLGSSVSGLYFWLERQGLPKGYQTLCANCNLKKRMVNREHAGKYD